MRKLRIAQIAPLAYRLPPAKYGGTERVIHSLTEALVDRGHDVTIFAAGTSQTRAKLVSVFPKSLRELNITDPKEVTFANLLNIGNAFSMQDQFDIIHDHMNPLSLAIANISLTPVVSTIHGAISPVNKRVYEKFDKPNLVSISKAQTSHFPTIETIANVYNGLPLKHYPFTTTQKGYLLFVGRFFKDKGAHYAISVAKELKLPLILAAKLEKRDEKYFKEYVEPHLGKDGIEWVGEVNEEERNKLMSQALCFLHPGTWAEPFGLTLIEAMACGCPVIAFNRGSIPEVIEDGKTGFVVNTEKEMIEAVKKATTLDRSYCRNYVLDNFNEDLMAKRYEDVYYKILAMDEREKYHPRNPFLTIH